MYFSRFGTVESVRLFSKGNFYSAFILFKTTRGAKAALSMKKHRINNRIVSVKEAKQCHQPDVKRSEPPNLNTLSAECLQKVFKQLHLRDLISVAEVNVRFKRNAEEVFKSTYQTTYLNVFELIEGDDSFHPKWFQLHWLRRKFYELFEQMLRNFGPLIKSLRLEDPDPSSDLFGSPLNEEKLFKLTQKYCPSLKELTLCRLGYDEWLDIELRPMFSGLEKLHLDGDVSDKFIELLSDCRELKHLRVDGGRAGVWVDYKFPKLESFEITYFREYDDKQFDLFFESHGNLHTLKMEDHYLYTSTIANIPKYLLNLETFCFNIGEFDDEEEDPTNENILQLSKLKSLKNLTMKCDASSMKLLVDAFSEENTPIEHFDILDCKIDDELVRGLSKLKSMKTLKLTGCEMAEGTLINLTQQLNEVNKLIVEDAKGVIMGDVKERLLFAQNLCLVNLPEELVRIPPDQSAADILNILDDDCLNEVFKFLPLRDLGNAADVCQHFQQIAKVVFESFHGSFDTDVPFHTPICKRLKKCSAISVQ